MLLLGVGSDAHVVEKRGYDASLAQEFFHHRALSNLVDHLVHELLEHSRGVAESKGHDSPFEHSAIGQDESGQLLGSGRQLHLPKP